MILNPNFDISGEMELMDRALAIAFAQPTQAVGWSLDVRNDEVDRLVFYWTSSYNGKECTLFPSPLGLKQIRSVIDPWLVTVDYGPIPDTDGHTRKGFRVYNEAFGHINHNYEAFLAVEPFWLIYGK